MPRDIIYHVMARTDVRTHLLRACDELEWVCEDTTLSEEKRLMGFVGQLRYVTEGDQMEPDPEALVTPDPNALDTIYERLIEVMEGADDEDARLGIRRACDELGIAIVTLNDRWERQHGVHVRNEDVRP